MLDRSSHPYVNREQRFFSRLFCEFVFKSDASSSLPVILRYIEPHIKACKKSSKTPGPIFCLWPSNISDNERCYICNVLFNWMITCWTIYRKYVTSSLIGWDHAETFTENAPCTWISYVLTLRNTHFRPTYNVQLPPLNWIVMSLCNHQQMPCLFMPFRTLKQSIITHHIEHLWWTPIMPISNMESKFIVVVRKRTLIDSRLYKINS